jgi:5-deoxy-D-glucuronate isomerase
MESTMKKYAGRIEQNKVNPLITDDGSIDGLIMDPQREEVPLEIIGFGIYRLGPAYSRHETHEKEVVLIPQNGEFEIEIDEKRFIGGRLGGPFAVAAGSTNASAVYIPCNARFSIRGKGEMAFFEAPAIEEKNPFYMRPGEVQVVSRGEWIWRRDVISLISPKNGSSNLIVGETFSPPGFWSGTPIHQHDSNRPSQGESDHEEIYYHRFGWRRGTEERFGAYGVQLLMDGKGLNKAFLISDRSIFAIPGGSHPVVASPVSDLLYLWGLAGRGGELAMRDIPEFAYIKRFEEIFKELEKGRMTTAVAAPVFGGLVEKYGLTERQKNVLSIMLREKGFEIPE